MNKFTIALLIKHPSIEPDCITSALHLRPFSFSKAGEYIVTPAGRILRGRYNCTSWLYTHSFETSRTLSEEIGAFLCNIFPAKDFLIKLSEENACCTLTVQFPGSFYQGYSISHSLLEKIIELKLNFGLEVFPSMQDHKAQ